MEKKKQITVYVIQYPGEKSLSMRYMDPVTGKYRRKSAKTSNPKKAEREAAKWQDELRKGKFKPAEDLTWEEFRERFEDQAVARKSSGYFSAFHAAFRRFEESTQIQMLRDAPDVIDKFELSLRRSTLSLNTVKSYLKHVRVALNWAVDKGMLESKPKIRLPETPEEMKGRPLTDAEFERICASVSSVVSDQSAIDSWRMYLKGLWLSGLRREESLILSWDEDAAFSIDMSGKYPRFKISASAQKSRRAQLLPMTPDFASWLLETVPKGERQSLVFNPIGKRGSLLTGSEVGRYVSEFGRLAEIETRPGSGKFASCHDFRRSFGTRWARKVMPAELKLLMRHSSVETTMKYYVGIEADDIAEGLWERFAVT